MTNEIGERIRRLRQAAGLTGRVLAEKVGTVQSYVSKVENGLIHPKRAFCERVISALNVSDDEAHALLNLLALYRAEHHPLSAQATALTDRQNSIRQLEATAREFLVYQPVLIPGLLQTRCYMSSLFSRYESLPHDVKEAVDARVARQRIILDSDRRFRFVIGESALRSPLSDARCMEQQLRALAGVAKRSNVDIRYLHAGTGWPPDVRIPMTGFEILDESVVIVDTLTGFTSFRHPDEITSYRETFSAIFDISRKAAPR